MKLATLNLAFQSLALSPEQQHRVEFSL